MEKHLITHHDGLHENIDALGWFWGSIRSCLHQKEDATIEDVLGIQKQVYRCSFCNRIFQSQESINKHFSTRHRDQTTEGRVASCVRLTPRIKFARPGEGIQMSESPSEAELEAEPQQETQERRLRPSSVFFRTPEDQRNSMEAAQRREAERNTEYQNQSRRYFQQRRIELQERVKTGVNIPALNASDVKRIRESIQNLFEQKINPRMERQQPNRGDPDEWEAFEGAYEESCHEIRECIMIALHRSPERIYGQRNFSPKMQANREKQATAAFNSELTQRKVGKFRDLLEQINELQTPEDAMETERRRNKFTKRFGELSQMIEPETMRQVFGTEDHRAIWQEMNQTQERRTQVMDWLDSLVTAEALKQINAANANVQIRKVQEAYRTSKSTAMRRYVNQKHSPPCQIEIERVTDHFRQTWSPPSQEFFEAQPDSEFFLEAEIPDEASDEMEYFMLSDEIITSVIQSRDDLSASGIDGISYRVFKAAGTHGVKFLKYIISASIRCGRTISSWKEGRTILIFKKGDQNEPANWRPITITNCIYRIFTCLMSRAFASLNRNFHVYSDVQKGFIRKSNGCSEHSILLNELFNDANRHEKNLIVTTIDFTNAFGSVPHELIMSTLKQRNFPEWMQEIIGDMYKDATSTIELRGIKTGVIGWNKGVKQGCPLSPLLFNLCIEPLLQAVRRKHNRQGYPVRVGDEVIRFEQQAYADDIVFISNTKTGIEDMLQTLESFTAWAKMEVNQSKCETASYIIDRNDHRRSLAEGVRFRGQEIPNLTISQSMKYLGVAASPHADIRMKSARTKIAEMNGLAEKIMGSNLLTVQKIDAMKTFVLPSLDYVLMNSLVGRKNLHQLDQKIRASINDALKIRGLPIECHHASWRDGGLSYPSLVDRGEVLKIRSFTQMLLSDDDKVRRAMRQFTEDERIFRRIEEDTRSTFLNWKARRNERSGTSSIIARTRKACKELGVSLNFEGMDGIRISGQGSSETFLMASGLGHFLTQKVIRPRLLNSLVNGHPQHGAAFCTLKDDNVSNKLLIDINSRRTDAFYRFLVAGRADCLPTPANVSKWFRQPKPECKHCGGHHLPTLAHILNRCQANYPQMTERHNKVVKVVYDEISHMANLTSNIAANTVMGIEGLSPEVAQQRPDLVFSQQDGNSETIDILEFSCPFGYRTHDKISIEEVYKEKDRKYQGLAEEVRALTGHKVRVTPVIVSSLGAVYKKSLSSLCQILRIENKKKRKKLGRKMSEAAILGSIEIWRKHVKQRAAEEAEMNRDEEHIQELEWILSEQEELPEEDEEENQVDTVYVGESHALDDDFEPGILNWSATEDERTELDQDDRLEPDMEGP
jgi:hypothetical protein